MFEDLNEKQLRVFNFIVDELHKKNYPPSVREICSALGFKSTSTAHTHLKKLEELKYIRKNPSKPRTIEILKKTKSDSVNSLNEEIISLPLVGTITAGAPILAVENIEEYYPLPASLITGKNCFLFKVKGDSMENKGILNGDFLIVDKCTIVPNGKMVIALINGEFATVKTFYQESTKIRLQPENDFMEPLYYNASEVTIIGRVIGDFRVIK